MPKDHIAGETYPERIRMGLLSRTFPPELVDFVVDEAGAREERTRSLPSRLTVYFILTMWLFTGYGYGLVLRELVEHLPMRSLNPNPRLRRPACQPGAATAQVRPTR
ncbi:transposase domain-containing protein [Actinacidiphila oryziradicis]|uniref:Transposase IS4 N-terminal domain-containing protein n=1 Tax=Actinacidiphila oryziradicis TaxID=2571141 RepID=A0A4U0SPS7_9ACTN|nr:transposase domain-containing protein [Actinacidiphila oryziradicis]TKA11906.1 hypothetical protein FCI23_08745 [Actinacidiphila oryziradicis]